MVQSIDSSAIISPQEMHQKVMFKELFSYDKDSKLGLSKAELSNYISDKEFNGSEIPEFAKKLMEKFSEIDQNKDGKLSGEEMSSLVNNRGMWEINPLAAASQANNAQNVSSSSCATGLLHNNIQELAQKGYNSVKNNPQLKLQAENLINKIM
ncbi:MAG: hypothetical protein WCF95_06255 [bacterium]